MEIKPLDNQKHKEAILEHFNTMDEEGYYYRFNTAYNESFTEQYVERLGSDFCLAVWDKSKIVGFLHLPTFGSDVEVGISISKAYRGLGLSTGLLAFGLSSLRLRSVNTSLGTVSMHCNSQNRASIALGRKFGLEVVVEYQNFTKKEQQTRLF